MIRASTPYTSGWGSFVLLKIDRVRVARGGSLSTLHLGCLPMGGSALRGCLLKGVSDQEGVCPGVCDKRPPRVRGRHPPVDRQTPVKT